MYEYEAFAEVHTILESPSLHNYCSWNAWTLRTSEFGDLQQSSPPIRTSLKEKRRPIHHRDTHNKIKYILGNSQFLLGLAFQILRSVIGLDTEIHY